MRPGLPAEPQGRPLPQILLVEPHYVLRRTVATVALELRMAQVHEAASHEAASRLLGGMRFDAMVIDIDPEGRALRLLQLLRGGAAGGPNPAGLPVLGLIDPAGAPVTGALADLHIGLLLARPFKARALLKAVEALVH